jgi:hypothetical protein
MTSHLLYSPLAWYAYEVTHTKMLHKLLGKPLLTYSISSVSASVRFLRLSLSDTAVKVCTLAVKDVYGSRCSSPSSQNNWAPGMLS